MRLRVDTRSTSGAGRKAQDDAGDDRSSLAYDLITLTSEAEEYVSDLIPALSLPVSLSLCLSLESRGHEHLNKG